MGLEELRKLPVVPVVGREPWPKRATRPGNTRNVLSSLVTSPSSPSTSLHTSSSSSSSLAAATAAQAATRAAAEPAPPPPSDVLGLAHSYDARPRAPGPLFLPSRRPATPPARRRLPRLVQTLASAAAAALARPRPAFHLLGFLSSPLPRPPPSLGRTTTSSSSSLQSPPVFSRPSAPSLSPEVSAPRLVLPRSAPASPPLFPNSRASSTSLDLERRDCARLSPAAA